MAGNAQTKYAACHSTGQAAHADLACHTQHVSLEHSHDSGGQDALFRPRGDTGLYDAYMGGPCLLAAVPG